MKPKSFFITFVILTTLVCISLPSKSQPFWEWTPIEALTDSLSDNTNVDFAHLYSDLQGEVLFMAWEKSVDSTATAIYLAEMLAGGEPQEVISTPGVHYTHPKILGLYYNSDTLFYLFFESDEAGNQDIYYIAYTVDGQIAGPYPFATGDADETGFNSGNEVIWFNTLQGKSAFNVLSWIENGDLMTCNIETGNPGYVFTEPVVLDTDNCYDQVVINQDAIYYIREDVSGAYIYSVKKTWPTYEWGDPQVFYNERNCFNLAQDRVATQLLAWSVDSNGVYRNILASTWNSSFDGFTLGPVSETPLDPAVSTIVIGVSPIQYGFYEYYLAFPYEDNGYDEIFLNPMYDYPPDFQNFSLSGTANRNPEFFLGEQGYYEWCFFVYLAWEEFRNGHWQIFSSKTEMCLGGIDETGSGNAFLKVWPNPFRDKVTVSFDLVSDDFIKIDVFDIYGRKVRDLYSGHQPAGEQELTWNGRDDSGTWVSPGIYLVRLISSDNQSLMKVLKTE